MTATPPYEPSPKPASRTPDTTPEIAGNLRYALETRMSEHPRYYLALHTRTRLLGTLNLAVALGGRSTGWGKGGKPRRTFVGRHRASIGGNAPFHRGLELMLTEGGTGRDRMLLRLPLGSGIAPLRRIPGLVANSHSRAVRE